MSTKVSLLFQVTTNPTDRAAANAHTGGWSEQFVVNFDMTSDSEIPARIARERAKLLPGVASAVGARLGLFDIVGNKMLPRGTRSIKFQFPGIESFATDLPQTALELIGKTAAGINANRFTLRCIPDSQMINGEYQPNPQFKRSMTNYLSVLAASAALGFVGRDLSQPTARVLSVVGNEVKLDGGVGAVVNSDYIRFNRVIDTLGDPIEGVFRVVGFVAPGTYTVTGLEGRTALAGGTARVDKLAFFDYSEVNWNRAVTRKIGRPFEAYRGRASKRRV